MSSITPNTPRTEPEAPGIPSPPPGARRTPGGGFWSFLRTLFVGTAGLAVLGVVGALAGSAWLTANQRAEAEKPQPWADPSFTTTAVTTGGLLARWMDNDGDLGNGHSYIQGIYNLWKTKQPAQIIGALMKEDPDLQRIPPLWRVEINRDLTSSAAVIEADLARQRSERIRIQLDSFK